MKLTRQKKHTLFIWSCIIPTLILFLIVMLIPAIEVFRLSFYRMDAFSPNETFVGLDNFKTLFRDSNFIRSMQNTIFLLVITTIGTLASALILSAIVASGKIKGGRAFQFIAYIPNVLSVVVIAGVFRFIYDYRNGLLNSLLSFFSLENLTQMWLGDAKVVVFSIAFAMMWQRLGYYMVMYTTSMTSIPISLYEAADLEGANPFIKFKDITLPLIWGNIRNTLIFLVSGSINLMFVLVQAMTNGGPNGASHVALSYMYNQAYTNSSYGYGMAISVVVFLFTFILTYAINKITARDVIRY